MEIESPRVTCNPFVDQVEYVRRLMESMRIPPEMLSLQKTPIPEKPKTRQEKLIEAHEFAVINGVIIKGPPDRVGEIATLKERIERADLVLWDGQVYKSNIRSVRC